MTDSSGDLRVSDAERQQVIDRLRTATAEGRLSLDEFEARIGEAWAAKTRSDLDHTMRELPAIVPDAPPPFDIEAEARRRYRQKVRRDLGSYVTTNTTCVAIWAMTGGHYFWPIWVLVPWGIGLVSKLARGPEDERKAIEREIRRREKKALRANDN